MKKRRGRRPSRAEADDEEPPADDAEKDADADKDGEKESDKDAEEADAESDTDADEADADTGTTAPKRTKPFMLDAALVLRGFQRHFSYTNDINNDLPNYDLGAAPSLGLDVGFFPLKNKKGSLTGGFVGSFDYAVGLGTTYKVQTPEQEGTKSTTAMAYAIGLRGNYVFGAGMGHMIGAGIDYGYQSFVVDHPPPVPGNANIPGVQYKFLRPNVSGRFGVSNKIAVLGSLGYLSISSAGEIVSADYFRGATSSAMGLDVSLGIGYEIKMSPKGALKYLELRPALTFRRYSFRFSPADEDPFYASGATDDYLGLNIGIATRL